MGLDQYAKTFPSAHFPNLKVIAGDDWDTLPTPCCDDFFYWRKHPDLQGWMEALYQSRGGTGDFNCVGVRLFPEDIDALERDVREKKLPKTTGFFFGTSIPADREDDLRFIEACRRAFERGEVVVYSSWW